MTVFVSIGLVFLGLAKINIWSDEKNPDYSNMIQTYKEYITDLDNMIGYP
jgi:hypothetical protein